MSTEPARRSIARRRNAATGRIATRLTDADAAWERLEADTEGLAALRRIADAVVQRDREGKTLSMGWDDIPD